MKAFNSHGELDRIDLTAICIVIMFTVTTVQSKKNSKKEKILILILQSMSTLRAAFTELFDTVKLTTRATYSYITPNGDIVFYILSAD